VIELLISSIHF